MDLLPTAYIERASQRFKLLSEPVRLELLNHLQRCGASNVQDLVEATGHHQANVSKHLLLMARHGLLHRRKDGLNVYYSIKDPTIQSLCLLVCTQLRDTESGERGAGSGEATTRGAESGEATTRPGYRPTQVVIPA